MGEHSPQVDLPDSMRVVTEGDELRAARKRRMACVFSKQNPHQTLYKPITLEQLDTAAGICGKLISLIETNQRDPP